MLVLFSMNIGTAYKIYSVLGGLVRWWCFRQGWKSVLLVSIGCKVVFADLIVAWEVDVNNEYVQYNTFITRWVWRHQIYIGICMKWFGWFGVTVCSCHNFHPSSDWTTAWSSLSASCLLCSILMDPSVLLEILFPDSRGTLRHFKT